MGFRSLGSGVWGLGFGSSGFRVWEFRVWGLGFRVWGSCPLEHSVILA